MSGHGRLVTVVVLVMVFCMALPLGYVAWEIRSLSTAEGTRVRIDEFGKSDDRLRNFVDIAYSVLETCYSMATSKEALILNHGGALRQVADTVHGILQSKYDRCAGAPHCEAGAREEALRELRGIRYGDRGYLWVIEGDSNQASIILHANPKFEGPVSDENQRQGVIGGTTPGIIDAIFAELAERPNEAFVTYVWPHPDGAGEVPKLAHARRFEPWNWVIITVLHVSDALEDNKKLATGILKRIRYDNGTGYFWINDTTPPIPNMVMHPQQPDLDGKPLTDPKYNCAGKTHKNVFQAFREVCEEDGEGFVDYLWLKTNANGSSVENVPKRSFVRQHDNFNWIVGTGAYKDDIARRVVERKNEFDDRLFWPLAGAGLIALAVAVAAGLFLFFFIRRSLREVADERQLVREVEAELTSMEKTDETKD